MCDFKNRNLYTYEEIENKIKELWNDNKEDMEGNIEEFKHYYGNDDDTIEYYYGIEIEDIFETQQYIIYKMEDAGFDITIDTMKKMTTINGLLQYLVYWIMEEIDFEELV
tara:strand:+ start:108 stop:437 length:330 start_codon:yes stop_codon:yes gene_type:complete